MQIGINVLITVSKKLHLNTLIRAFSSLFALTGYMFTDAPTPWLQLQTREGDYSK